MMKDSPRRSGSSIYGIEIGGNLPGLLFTVMGILWVCVPGFRGFLALSIAAGSVIAVVLRILHRKSRINRVVS